MKIFTMCTQCIQQYGIPSFEPIIADYFDDSIANVECSNGHKSALLLQSHKFEVLLESGANAIIDGYTIEAAATFYAAYERFFEFAINVFCNKHKIDLELIRSTFKQMQKQSERQVGAFLFLHLLTLGKEYKLNIKITETRNKVIHQGFIPTLEETMKFCNLIYKEIYTISQILLKSFPNEVQKTIMDELEARNKKIPNSTPRATSTGTMFFSSHRAIINPLWRKL